MPLHVEVCPDGEAVARQASELLAGQATVGADVPRRLQAGDSSIPAGRICAASATVIADEAPAEAGA